LGHRKTQATPYSGYTLNQKRLKEKAGKYEELQQTLKVMKKALHSRQQLEATEAEGLLHVITDFSYSLEMLDRYDHEQLEFPDTGSPDRWKITYEQAREAIEALRGQTQASELFGREKDQSFKSSIATIYQSFDGKEFYPTAEQKAAHLLYFVVKNHSFSDGNKRIAACLFLLFLEKNGLLYTEEGEKAMADSTLVAITLMIAESNPGDKEMIIKVVVHLLQQGVLDE
jgi:death-on-curing family protein